MYRDMLDKVTVPTILHSRQSSMGRFSGGVDLLLSSLLVPDELIAVTIPLSDQYNSDQYIVINT